MNWNEFLPVLLLIYAIYYGINLAYDAIKDSRLKKIEKPDESIDFEHLSAPTLIEYESPLAPLDEAISKELENAAVLPMHGETSGGVLLDGIFKLAKEGLIHCNKGIAYG